MTDPTHSPTVTWPPAEPDAARASVEDQILAQHGLQLPDALELLHDADRQRSTCQQILQELAGHIGALRGPDPRGHHGERAASLTRWLLTLTRPTAAQHVQAGMGVDQALQLVDSEAYRDRRHTAVPPAPAEIRRALEAA